MNSTLPILVMKAETLQSCYGQWQECHAINFRRVADGSKTDTDQNVDDDDERCIAMWINYTQFYTH